MPDRKGGSSNEKLATDGMEDLQTHWIHEGNVCETGWPNMRLTITMMAGWVLLHQIKH